MIQAAQVASKFTLFTHHAKTFPNLITALRNSMLRTGVFKDEKTAEEQVVQVLNFDIHLVKDFRGRRYIERITECIPIEEKNEYTFDHRKEKTMEGKIDKFFDNAAIFFGKTTNRELYKYKNILEFVDDSYVLSNPISEPNIKAMRENMDDDDIIKFDEFLERNWGIKPEKSDRDLKAPEEIKNIKSELKEKTFNEEIDIAINKEEFKDENLEKNTEEEKVEKKEKKSHKIGTEEIKQKAKKVENSINEGLGKNVKTVREELIKKTLSVKKKLDDVEQTLKDKKEKEKEELDNLNPILKLNNNSKDKDEDDDDNDNDDKN